MPEELWTLEELAVKLRLSLSTVQRLRAQGKLPRALRVGNGIRFRPADYEAWIMSGGLQTIKDVDPLAIGRAGRIQC